MKPLVLVLCLILSLAACNGAQNAVFENSIDTPPSSKVESEENYGQNIKPPHQEQKPQSAVLPQLLNVDKTLAVTGELKDQKYAQKVEELQAMLRTYSNNIALSVCSLDGSKGLFYNTNAEIFGACTVKAGYTLYACMQMEQGNGNLQTQLVYQEKHYEPCTGDMQYSPFGTVFSMETALHKSMSISDNVGYLMSVDYFGREGYNEFINDLGCPSLVIKPTVWSLRTKSNDLIKVWSEIYNYFVTDSGYAKFLYNSCTNTTNNYIKTSLGDVNYSHKEGFNSTGDWLSYSDAGIVWKGDIPYIIALLTDSPGRTKQNAEIIPQITNIIHNNLF